MSDNLFLVSREIVARFAAIVSGMDQEEVLACLEIMLPAMNRFERAAWCRARLFIH